MGYGSRCSVPPHMRIVRMGLDLCLGRDTFKSRLTKYNFGDDKECSNQQIFAVLEAASQRSTTKADDEWIVLASALNVDTRSILLHKSESRAKAFYTEMEMIPETGYSTTSNACRWRTSHGLRGL